MPDGASCAAALTSAVFEEALRKLPEIASTRIAPTSFIRPLIPPILSAVSHAKMEWPQGGHSQDDVCDWSSVVVALTWRENRHAIRICHAHGDDRTRRCQLTKRVIRKGRQVRLTGPMVDDAEHTCVRVDVRRRSGRDLGGDLRIDEDVAARSNQTANRPAGGIGDEHVLAGSCRPA